MTSHIPHRFPGRRSFIAGSLILILFGLVHTIVVLAEAFNPPDDARLVALHTTMRELKVERGPFNPSEWALAQILTNSYSLLLVGLGIIGLLVVRPMAMVGRLRALTTLFIMLTGTLVLINVLWMFPPPLLFSGLALAAFCSSMVRQSMLRPAA
jgi:hypothetical protein